jgi:hypothetical protein
MWADCKQALAPVPVGAHVYVGCYDLPPPGFQSEPPSFELIGRAFFPDRGWLVSDGDIAEILVFEGTLSDPERSGVVAYLRGRYGL